MKKTALLAALASIGAAANAQSSVTLFGVLDAAARYTKNGDLNIKSLSSGGINTSRFGVRGSEDLGDGLKANFWLEAGFNVDDATQSDAARFWNRRSTASLSGNFGEVRLGRDFSVTYNGYTAYDAFGSNGVASSDKFQGKLGTSVDTLTRADNQISYFLPAKLGGFYGQAAVSAAEGVVGKRTIAGRAGFASGPFDVSASYGQTKVLPNAAGDDKYATFDLGGFYDFGAVKLTGYYTRSTYSALKLQVFNLGALVPVGRGTIRVGYIDANASGGVTDSNDGRQIALGYIYNFSKRTALYATAAKVINKGLATFVVATPPALVAGQNSTGYELGLRHAF